MRIIKLFSEEVSKLWNGWEVRVLILLSLLLQIILIVYGSQRKYKTGIRIKIIVWSAYLAADWVATVALGNLAKIQADSENNSSKSSYLIQAFWAPFLLLHLGGPDTITAYSLEDNELWPRHFLGLVIEVGVAFYVIFRSWSNSVVSFISIPIFVIGIIKYGERTYVLRATSTKHFKEALISTKPVTEKAMLMAMGITEEDFFKLDIKGKQGEIFDEKHLGPNEFFDYVEEARFLYKRFVHLFGNLILGFNDRVDCYNIIHQKSAKDAFKLVATELGFLYDELYTKTRITPTRLGVFLRSITFFSTVSTLVVFSVTIDKHVNHVTDIYITWLLLIGAVFLEFYAFVVLLFSDRTKLWLLKRRTPQIELILSVYNECSDSVLINQKRWSESMAQFNLTSYCVEDRQGLLVAILKLPCIRKLLEEYIPYTRLTCKKVSGDLQQMIFSQLKKKGEELKDNYSMKACKELLARRGDYVLKKFELDEYSWSTIELEFDHSLLVWHIATNLCHYDDLYGHKDGEDEHKFRRKDGEVHEDNPPQKDGEVHEDNPPPKDGENEHKFCHKDEENETGKFGNVSECLSDYMLYLLILCPSMLPKGIGEIRFRDTCAHVKQLLQSKKSTPSTKTQLCEMMLDEIIRRPINQSVLCDGCELARKLQTLNKQAGWDSSRKWRMISEVWVEMLAYAANHCGWKDHGQQLWKGGELLTHVCVLMAHLGLSEQYNEKELLYLL